MTCFHPLEAYKPDQLISGDTRLKFVDHTPFNNSWMEKRGYLPLKVSCGQCIGCRLERSRQWAVRCVHEAQMHTRNCFITLTYDPMHLPEDGSLHKPDFQKFMKRFRDRIKPLKIRFYMCGEYGELHGRPHYHALIFGYDFDDKVLFKVNNGVPLYTSELLSDLWPFGHASIGDVTFQSAAYVARYIMKKQTGKGADEHYFDTSTGVYKTPEYNTMSRGYGIGKKWLEKYSSDVYPSDYVVMNEAKMQPPRYYDDYYSNFNPYEFDEIKQSRLDNLEKYVDNNTPERLKVREQVQLAKLNQLPRNL